MIDIFRAPVVALLLYARLHAQSVAIEGHVTDSISGKPLAAAIVSLRSASGGAGCMGETDADGRFRYDLTPGRYYIFMGKEGYAEQFTPPAPVMLPADQPVTRFELHAEPLAVISGRVLDADGDPLIGISVALMVQRIQTPAHQKEWFAYPITTTNDLGEFRFFDVPARPYYVRASSGNRPAILSQVNSGGVTAPAALATTYYPGVTNIAEAAPVRLAAGRERNGVDIHMVARKLSTVRGRIPDIQALRLDTATARFSVVSASNPLETCCPVDAEGRFETPPLAPGTHNLDVVIYRLDHSQEPLYGRKTVDLDGQDLDGVEVPVTPSPSRSQGPLQLVVRFQVEGPATAKIDELGVYLVPDSGAGGGQMSNSSDGTRLGRGLFPGNSTVRVDEFRGVYLKSVRQGDTILEGNRINLQASGTVTLVLGTDLGLIDGAVVDERGKPVPGAHISLISDPFLTGPLGRARSDASDTNGEFTMRDVTPGAYRLYAWSHVDEPSDPVDPEFRKPYEDRALQVSVAAGSHVKIKLNVIMLDPPAQK